MNEKRNKKKAKAIDIDNVEESKVTENAQADDATSQTDESGSAENDKDIDSVPVDSAEEVEDKIRELENKYLRLAAEFDNYKKRTAREFTELVKSANRDLLLQILPIIDHINLALKAEAGDKNAEGLKKGLELIDKELKAFMEKMGVEEIEAVGKIFDPNVHEALMQAPSEDYDEGIVMDESQKGYLLGDKILRPSKVVISTGPPSEKKEA